MTFLYPVLLWFLSAVGVLFLIHLLRPRVRVRDWGAWELLRRAAKESRVRTRIHSLLLLLLRTALLLLLIFLLAGPVLKSPSPENTRETADKRESGSSASGVGELNLVLAGPVGDTASRQEGDAFLRAALEAALAPDVQTGFHLRFLRTDEISGETLADADLLFLISPEPDVISPVLSSFLATGKAACVIPSTHADGATTFPDSAATWLPLDPTLFHVFDVFPELLDEVTVTRYLPDAASDTGRHAVGRRLLASTDQGEPLVWSESVGKGTLLCFRTSWSDEWSNLASSIAFPILVQDMVSWLTSQARETAAGNTAAGNTAAGNTANGKDRDPIPVYATRPVFDLGLGVLFVLLAVELWVSNRPFRSMGTRGKGGSL